jgi:hypothetical protein
MAKSQPVKDPAAFLKDLVARRGQSQRYATVFHGANVLFCPHEHSHSDTYQDSLSYLRRIAESSEEYRKVIACLTHTDRVEETFNFPEYFGLTGVFAYIRNDREEGFSITFCFPMADIRRFHVDVEILSHIALHWAKLARKDLDEVRVFINYAYLRWEDMEEGNLLYTEYESN